MHEVYHEGSYHTFHVSSGGYLIHAWYNDVPQVGSTNEVLLSGCDKYAQAYCWIGNNGWMNVACSASNGDSRRIYWDSTHWRDAYGNQLF
jgi:hypothetical protein